MTATRKTLPARETAITLFEPATLSRRPESAVKAVPASRAVDGGSSSWQFWHDDAPEISMTIVVGGDGSASEITDVINEELARVLGHMSLDGPVTPLCIY
jgi:hypothetical protein